MSRRLRWAPVGSLAVVLVLAVLVRLPWRPLTTWDQRVDIDAHVAVLDRHWLLDAARWLTHVGDPAVVTVLTFLIAAALARRNGKAAVYVLVVRAVAVAFDTGLKAAVGRARPVLAHPVAHASGHSFPSGHSLGTAALWGSVAVLVWNAGRRRVATLTAVGVPVVVATTRVLLGVHYVTDVVAGLLLGWTCAVGAFAVVRRDVGGRHDRALP